MIFALTLSCFATAICSGLHGWGKISKGYIIAAHVLASIAAAWLSGLPPLFVAPTGAAVSLLWWFALRTGWQADEELNYMDTARGGKFWSVVLSYAPFIGIAALLLGAAASYRSDWFALLGAAVLLPTMLIPAFCVKLFNYGTSAGQGLGWNHGGFLDCRRMTELTAGFLPGGGFIVALIYTVKLGAGA